MFPNREKEVLRLRLKVLKDILKMLLRCEYKTLKVRLKSFRKYILKEDSRSFYNAIQDIQELGRRSSKIGKKKFLDSDKKF